MRQYNKILPALGMALYFCSVYLGAALTAVGRGYTESGKIPAILHIVCLLAIGLLLSLYLRRKGSLPRCLPLCLGAISLLCLAAPFFIPADTLSGKGLILPACALCLFLPVGLYLFFAAVPQYRQATVLGCALASGELVWIVALPMLHLYASIPHKPETISYLYSFLCFSVAGVGVCLAATLAEPMRKWPWLNDKVSLAKEPEKEEQAPSAPKDNRTSTPVESKAKKALFWLFTGFAVTSTLLGLTLGELPRATGNPQLSGSIYFILLFVAPVAGALLDSALSSTSDSATKHPALSRFLLCLAAVPIMAVPVLCLFQGFGLSGELPLLLLAIRLVLQVTVFVIAARLAGNHYSFPLIGTLVWCMVSFQLAGIMLADWFTYLPNIRLFAAFVLALCAVVSLWVFAVKAEQLPQLRAVKSVNSAPPANIKDTQEKRTAFAAVFGYTTREKEVLDRILEGQDNTTIGEALGVSETTVKFHLRSLLRKTGQINRKRLAQFYMLWKS